MQLIEMNKKSSPGQMSTKNSRLKTNNFLEDPSIAIQDDAIVELGTLENELD